MKEYNKLPKSEFEVMKSVWDNPPFVTTNLLMEQIGEKNGWKTPALISFLNRLINKGFLSSGKNGKERFYKALVSKEDYIQWEAERFFCCGHILL